MTIPAVSLIVLIFTISLSASLEVPPEVTIKGDTYFLAIFDLHKETDDDGNCINLSAKGIDALMALQWSNEFLNKNNQTDLGLLVYDACGSKRLAMAVVGEYINSGGCQNISKIAGVITFVSNEVQKTIVDVLRPFGIIHAGVSPKYYITSGSGLSLSVAGVSLWKTQAALSVLEQFKWNYVNVFFINKPLAQAERDAFLKMIAPNEICAHVLSESNLTTALRNTSSNVVLIFAPNYAKLDDLISITSSENEKMFLIVSDSNVELTSVMPSNKTLFLQETGPVLRDLLKYLENKFTIVNESDTSVISKFVKTLPYCEVDHQFNHSICNSGITKYWQARLKDRVYSNILSAYYNLFRIISNKGEYGCTGFDFSKCMDAVKFVSVDISLSGFPFKTRGVFKGYSIEERFQVVLGRGLSGSDKVANITDKSVSFAGNLESYQHSECRDSCGKCGECFLSGENSRPVVIGSNGDVILTAGFPIYKDSINGDKCSELSKDSVIMAQSFLYAVDTVKSMYPSENLLAGVSVGGLVYDTCGGKTLDMAQLNRNSKCNPVFYNGKDNMTISGKIVSDVRYVESPINEKNLAMDKSFNLSPFGLSLSSNFYDVYLDALMTLLKSQSWTYVAVVYSEESSKLETVKNKMSQMRKSGICISEEINIGSSTINYATSRVENVTVKTGAVILLTNKEDTLQLMKHLSLRQFNYHSTNFVFFAWNTLHNAPKGSITITPSPLPKQTLKNELKKLSILDNGYYKGPVTEMSNYWWVKYHENSHKCHISVDRSTLYPYLCTKEATFSSNDVDRRIHVSSLIVSYVDTVVSILDSLHKTKCLPATGACKAFMSYNDFGHYIEETVPNYVYGPAELKFSSYGTMDMKFSATNTLLSSKVLVYTIDSGRVARNGQEQFLAYDSTNISTVIKHECSGWCPSCMQCQTSNKQNTDYYYNPADIDILGMFPVHTKQQQTDACDIADLVKGSDILIEAFLYALNTAKIRFPYILPEVSIGSLVADTCSNVDKSLQIVSNFETCFASFSSLSGKMASPESVPSYFLYFQDSLSDDLKSSVIRRGKYAISHFTDFKDSNSMIGKLEYSYSRSETLAVTDFLSRMKWTYVSVVVSSSLEYTSKVELFKEFAKERKICIASVHTLATSGSISRTKQRLQLNTVSVIVLFLSVEDIRLFFDSVIVPKVHVIGNTDIIWEETTADVRIPLGSIIIDRIGKVNNELKVYLDNVKSSKVSMYGNPWLTKFITERENCPVGKICNLPHDLMIQTSRIVTEMDIVLHALHNMISRACGQNGGLCKKMESDGLALLENDFMNITFGTSEDRINLSTENAGNGAFQISNFQNNAIMKVGNWSENALVLSKEQIRVYSSSGTQLSNLPLSKCIGTCVCININSSVEEPTVEFVKDAEKLYFNSSGAFENKLWLIVVLAVACGGVAACLLFFVYVIYKTCVGLLNKRYIGLGILLLLSLMALYLSVLPYVFTPSEVGCTARHLLPSITYSIVYATCLSKLMSLRAYKLIGLGGELSNLNQFLSVTFISGVQIAISVQYVSIKGSFLERHIIESEETYSCKFERGEFVVYLVYDMFLIIVCSLYALTVRKEKKNMGEAIFILICSWINIALWIAWVAVMMIISREFVELTICVGILACATVITATVFVPKLHKISKLKYDVKKSGVQNGGYKIDTDFMFERPHTLPGGFKNSYNMSPTRTNPKSISAFDSGLSY